MTDYGICCTKADTALIYNSHLTRSWTLDFGNLRAYYSTPKVDIAADRRRQHLHCAIC